MLDTSLYQYSTRFQCFANVITPSEREELMAKASLGDLQGLLPEGISPSDNPDFLYFAANGAVAGMANANDDSISVETALEIYPFSKNKYISVDHKKEIVVGSLLYPGLSEFGNNELITPEQAGKLDTFNLSLVGIVWKAIKKELIPALVNASDVTHPSFGRISLSWEIFFKDYNIAIGSKVINKARIITEPADKEKLKPFLKCNGGPGFVDGEKIYRVISGDDAIIGGYSFVTNPAADVEGVFVFSDKPSDNAIKIEDAPASIINNNSQIVINNVNSTSQSEKTIVNKQIDKIMPTINNIEDIASQWESFKTLEAVAAKNQIDKLFEDGIRAADDKWKKQLAEKDEALAKIQSEAKHALEQVQAVQKTLADTQSRLNDIENEKANKVKAEVYNERMADLDSEYDLDDDDRQVLAPKIKDLQTDDACYADFKKEWAVVAKEKSKAFKEKQKQALRELFIKEHNLKSKADDDDGDDSVAAQKDKKTKEVVESSAEAIASEALDGATVEQITLSNGVQPASDILKNMTAAFTKGIKFASYNKRK